MEKVKVAVTRNTLVSEFFEETSTQCFKMGREVLEWINDHDLEDEANRAVLSFQVVSNVSCIQSVSSGCVLGFKMLGLEKTGMNLDELEDTFNELNYQSFLIGCGDMASCIAKIMLKNEWCEVSEVVQHFANSGEKHGFQA